MINYSELNGLAAATGLPRLDIDHNNITSKIINEYNKIRINPDMDLEYKDTIAFEHVAKATDEYKAAKGKKDFTDLLTEGLIAAKNLDLSGVDALIIDEAQDLSPLQWDIVRVLSTKINDVFIAGDDDQEIYGFNGASAESMLRLPAEGYSVRILPQSYRIPERVHSLSQKLIATVQDRYYKPYAPREEKGLVRKYSDIEHVPFEYFTDPDILFLSRTNHHVEEHKTRIRSLTGGLLSFNDKQHKTIHQSKGLEANTVFVFLAVTNKIANSAASTAEAKIFYVAVTRAKQNLIIIGNPAKEYTAL